MEVEQNLRDEIDTLKRFLRLETAQATKYRRKVDALEKEKKSATVLLKDVKANGPKSKVAPRRTRGN